MFCVYKARNDKLTLTIVITVIFYLKSIVITRMASFKNKCVEYFGTNDFYEVLRVSSNATEKEIKKAYHKLSLLVHPDRVSDSEKEVATEKFKVLGRIHSILQNKEKRKIYDDCGDFDEEGDSSFNWMEYWRAIFKTIELKDIENYEKEYIGSETELLDIKKAYVNAKGNMDVMLQLIPFSNCDNEPRIIDIVRKMVDDGEVEEYKGFFNEPPAKKRRRHKKWEEERKLAESINMSDLERDINKRREERISEFASFVSDLESKYCGKRKSITNGSSASARPKRRQTSKK